MLLLLEEDGYSPKKSHKIRDYMIINPFCPIS